jgi:hypothetical protein
MHKAEVAALQEYEDALTEFLTSVRARDGRSDFPFMAALIAKISEASCECYQVVRSCFTFHLPKTYG